jgi:hypothetical protein
VPDDDTDPTDEPQETREAKEKGTARGGESTPPEPGGGKPQEGTTDEDAS